MNSNFILYNSKSRKKEELKTITPGELKFYACGPTVYSYAHIGNFRSFLTADLIVRTAQAIGLTVNYVSNITDVGHLTQDDMADAQGEDKMARALRSAEQQFSNIWDLARFYTDALLLDWKALGLREPRVRPRAAEHVAEQLELIDQLVKTGYAYETKLGVYFDVHKFPNYGALSGNSLEKLKESVRDTVNDEGKKNPQDFALWKKDENHLMRWYSPYGWGYPGWHIECSAMAMKYLGESFDLHSGGEDNKFPHHECEIAQSEAVTKKTFAHHWVHTAHLLVDGQRMSKSLGNFLTVDEVLARGVHPRALRHALTCAIYRETLNFTKESLEASQKIHERAMNTYEVLCKRKLNLKAPIAKNAFDWAPKDLQDLYHSTLSAMCDDLNTPQAYAHFLAGIKFINTHSLTFGPDEVEGCLAWFVACDQLLGLLGLDQQEQKKEVQEELSEDQADLLKRRNRARADKDFKLADELRDELGTCQGILINDTPQGTEWKFAKDPFSPWRLFRVVIPAETQ